MIETDVLIVGSGPAGSSAAALLSTYGVDNVLVTKYRWLADTPRAHITNQRTMEVLRDLGVEAEAMLHATPSHLMGNNVFCTSLAGEELGRMRSWGADPMTQAASAWVSSAWCGRGMNGCSSGLRHYAARSASNTRNLRTARAPAHRRQAALATYATPLQAVLSVPRPSSWIIRSRMTNFWTLPVTVIGNASTKRTYRGTL
jgi:FAD binding domain